MKQVFTLMNSFRALCLVLLLVPSLVSGQVDGDYRTRQAAVTWSTGSHWQIRSSGAWATAVSAPTSSANVYIQSGHTATIDATSTCNALNLHTSGVIATTTNALEVSGKLRAYTGTAVTTTADMTTTSSTSPVNGMITSGSGGKVKFVGNTRNITNTGEWGATGLVTSAVIEFALSSGQVGTFATGFKTNTIIISSGTMDMGTNRLAPDNNVVGGGTCTIKSGATLKSNQSSAAVISRTGSSAMGTLDLQSGATLELSGAAPSVWATTFTNAGTIIYSGVAAQAPLKQGSAGVTIPTTCTNMIITNTLGVTLAGPMTASGNVSFTGGGKLLLGANDLTVNGTVTGGAIAGYVVTNGAGKLTQPATPIGALFPIGQSATSYDPVAIKPASTQSFGARVGAQTTALGTSPMNPGAVVNAEWDITGTAGTVDLVFVSAALNKDGSATRPTIGTTGIIGHFSGGVWEGFVSTYLATNTWAIAGYTGSFSPFLVAGPGAVLSVELSDIAVKSSGNANVVAWSTASEKNNAQFDVQHATNGRDFRTVGTVKGNGTTNTVSNYAFEHAAPVVGTNYYRLNQVDANGAATLSKVVSIQFGGKKGDFKVFPTLAFDKVTVLTNSDQVQDYTISNLLGQTVLTGRLTNGTDVTISALSKGIYILKVAGETVKFSKQ